MTLGPGPGYYSVKGIIGKDSPSAVMKKKHSYDPMAREALAKPGPAQYTVNHAKLKERAPSYKIGSASRIDVALENRRSSMAAPGEYTPKVELTSKRSINYKFGTDKRKGLVLCG